MSIRGAIHGLSTEWERNDGMTAAADASLLNREITRNPAELTALRTNSLAVASLTT